MIPTPSHYKCDFMTPYKQFGLFVPKPCSIHLRAIGFQAPSLKDDLLKAQIRAVSSRSWFCLMELSNPGQSIFQAHQLLVVRTFGAVQFLRTAWFPGKPKASSQFSRSKSIKLCHVMPCHITPACHTFPQLKYVLVNSRMWYPEQIFCKSGVKLCKGWQTHSMNGRSML